MNVSFLMISVHIHVYYLYLVDKLVDDSQIIFDAMPQIL